MADSRPIAERLKLEFGTDLDVVDIRQLIHDQCGYRGLFLKDRAPDVGG